MKERHPKGLNVKPLRDFGSFPEAFFILGGDPMITQDFKRKLTAVFSADVAGYSRLMGEDEAATVRTLEAYKQVMFSLIKQHRGRVIDSPGDNLLPSLRVWWMRSNAGVAVQNELQARNADLPENRKYAVSHWDQPWGCD